MPEFRSNSFTRLHVCAAGVTSALENPPINPVTGPGRTATEVQRETEGYRAYVRQRHGERANPPVFQGDYIFVQLPSKPIFLARVVGHCIIDDALANDISITIGEYSHEPQQRVPGFFGWFSINQMSRTTSVRPQG